MSYAKSKTLQSAASATGNGSVFDVSGMDNIAIQVSGTFTATVNFEGSNDNATWAAVPFFNSSGSNASSASAAGMFVTNLTGYQLLRARVTWTSGTSVTVIASGC
jgi:hypothetical protein